MSENILIVSNWKMNLNLDNAKKLLDNLKKIKLGSKPKSFEYCMPTVPLDPICFEFTVFH